MNEQMHEKRGFADAASHCLRAEPLHSRRQPQDLGWGSDRTASSYFPNKELLAVEKDHDSIFSATRHHHGHSSSPGREDTSHEACITPQFQKVTSGEKTVSEGPAKAVFGEIWLVRPEPVLARVLLGTCVGE